MSMRIAAPSARAAGLEKKFIQISHTFHTLPSTSHSLNVIKSCPQFWEYYMWPQVLPWRSSQNWSDILIALMAGLAFDSKKSYLGVCFWGFTPSPPIITIEGGGQFPHQNSILSSLPLSRGVQGRQSPGRRVRRRRGFRTFRHGIRGDLNLNRRFSSESHVQGEEKWTKVLDKTHE